MLRLVIVLCLVMSCYDCYELVMLLLCPVCYARLRSELAEKSLFVMPFVMPKALFLATA